MTRDLERDARAAPVAPSRGTKVSQSEGRLPV
jgi:hypothetical protein